MRITLLFILLLAITAPIKGQQFTLQNYTDENGLPQNSVKSITTDNVGFMWFATESGLVRYDGQNFILFDKTQTKANSYRISSLQKDPNTNKLYGITEDWELIEIKDGKVLPTRKDYSAIFNFENSTPFTHFITWGEPSGLDFYKDTLPYIIQKRDKYFYKIYNQTISLFKENKLLQSIKFNYKNQYQFFLLGNNLYYLDKEAQLFKFENNKMTPIKLAGDLQNQSNLKSSRLFWNINSELVYIGVNNTLYELSTSINNQFVTVKKLLDNLNFEALGIRSIFTKTNNNDVYIGTLTKGLFIYKKKQFNTLLPANNYENNVFYAQIPFDNNQILFANGYLFNKNNSKKRFNFFDKITNRYTIAIDKNKNIWTEKNKTIYKLSSDLKQIVNTYNFSTRINIITITDDETIYLGNYKGVYYLNKNEDKFQLIDKLKSITDVSFIQKSKQFLWIGTRKGLFYYDFKTDQVFYVKALKNKDIRSIHIRNEQVWVTTYGDGYYLINNHKIIRLPNDKNNYLNAAHCILEDNNGFFWISTNKGLFKAAVNDLLAYANKKTQAVYYSYYDRSAGFNTNEFNGGCQPCGSILNDGDFIFPTMNGVVMFNPLKLINNEPEMPIYIDQISLDNRDLKLTNNALAIPLKFNRLTIHLSTPYFGNKENLFFEYKLANQSIWTKSIDQIISFSYLPSGKNTLNIRKVNGFGIHNYSYKNISLIVPLHYYETWWFILSCFIFLMLFIFSFIKLRTKIIKDRNIHLEKRINESTIELQQTIKAYESSKNRLDHQNYFQNKLIDAITHDIKTPLKYLNMTAEALIKVDSKKIDKEGLKAVYTSSSQIYHFTDNLVQYAKGFTTKDLESKHTFNLHALIEEKIAIFSQIAKGQNTIIINTIDKNVSIKTNQQLLAVIIHNLLDNAVKFTFNGKIKFSYLKHVQGYTITISDTGIGLKPYQVEWCNNTIDNLEQTKSLENTHSPAGLGLIMVKELNKIINGKLKAHAVLGEGTTFEITLND